MSEPIVEDTDITPDLTATPPVKIGHPIVAWLVIVSAVALVLVRNAASAGPTRTGFDRGMMLMQSRYLVGVADLFKQREAFYKQAETLRGHDYEQRLCFAVLAGELSGPKEALEQLGDLPDDPDADTETAAALIAINRTRLKNLAEDGKDEKNDKPKQPAVDPPADAVNRVRDKLGWFGDLAAAPPETTDSEARARAIDPARRTALVLFSAFAVALLVGLAGLAALVIVGVLAASDMIKPRLITGSPYGGVYAETFALWMVLYIGMSYGASFLPVIGSRLLVSGMCMLASLGVLAWPVIRGVPWFAVRQDVGLTTSRPAILDMLAGGLTYAAAFPMLAIGAILALVLSALAKRVGLPGEIGGHPLAPFVIQTGLWGRIQALLVASVIAPIVEETMFRGLLYRHLREATAPGGRIVSVLLSSLGVCFVFAVIHPQGWFGVPPLMALAFAFCLARELRGTLLPAMVAHCLQNTAVTLLVIFAAG
jgi:membrane protease YdiL (CAAX protease family)